MTNFKDILKSALDKKHGGVGGKSAVNKNTKGQSKPSQVVDHKPARKSAGRGR